MRNTTPSGRAGSVAGGIFHPSRGRIPVSGAGPGPGAGARTGGDPRWARPRRALPPLLALLALAALGASCSDVSADPSFPEVDYADPVPLPEITPEEIEVPPPPFSEGVFPCSDCHDPELPVRGTRRELKLAHQDIVLHHDEQNRWCLDCHDKTNFDVLHLASGEQVSFEQSYRLCGQCHGDKYRDWRAGIHGRRTGDWNGEKSYLLCVHCHDSHSPAFKPLEPMPAPNPPRRTK